jgi:hypothetical protein
MVIGINEVMKGEEHAYTENAVNATEPEHTE